MIKLKSLIKESLLGESYLKDIGFDFPELKRLSSEQYKELEDLMQDQDDLIDIMDSDTAQKWFDAGSRGVNSFEEFVKSENDLLDILPNDNDAYAELKSTIEDILTILYQDNDIEL